MMRLLPILERLFWKEFCQGWLMLTLGLLLPPLAGNLPHLKLLTFDMPSITLFVLLLGISVWAAMLAGEARGRQSYAGVHFPQHPALASIVTFVLQGCAAALIGFSIGFARVKLGNPAGIADLPLWAMLYAASTFAVSFIAALALSPWGGMVAGIIWMLGYLSTFSDLITCQRFSDGEPIMTMQHMSGVIVMAFISIVILLLAIRLNFTWRRALACILLGIVILSRPLWSLAASNRQNTNYILPAKLSSADGTLVVDYDRLAPNKDYMDLHFVNYRQQHTDTRHFAQEVQPLCFIGKNAVMLAQQRKKERHVTLLRWTLDTNTVEPFASIAARPESLAITNNGYDPKASLSRDGHYGVIILPSPYSEDCYGFDIWKIDLQLRKVTLLKPAWPAESESISWRGNDAIISSWAGILSVSMTTGQVTPQQFPTLREGK